MPWHPGGLCLRNPARREQGSRRPVECWLTGAEGRQGSAVPLGDSFPVQLAELRPRRSLHRWGRHRCGALVIAWNNLE